MEGIIATAAKVILIWPDIGPDNFKAPTCTIHLQRTSRLVHTTMTSPDVANSAYPKVCVAHEALWAEQEVVKNKLAGII